MSRLALPLLRATFQDVLNAGSEHSPSLVAVSRFAGSGPPPPRHGCCALGWRPDSPLRASRALRERTSAQALFQRDLWIGRTARWFRSPDSWGVRRDTRVGRPRAWG